MPNSRPEFTTADRAAAARPDAAPGALSSRIMHSRRLGVAVGGKRTPFDRMQQCRDALERLDKKGWNRSFHQRLFHEDFLVRPASVACMR